MTENDLVKQKSPNICKNSVNPCQWFSSEYCGVIENICAVKFTEGFWKKFKCVYK